MSDLDDLIDAARERPSAGVIRGLVSAARGAETPRVATEFLAALDPGPHDAAVRELVASFLLDHAAPNAALAWTRDQEGAAALVQARALLALGRDIEARDSYVAALALFPQLRDAVLDERLATAQARTVGVGPSPSGEGGNVVPINAQARGAERRADRPQEPAPGEAPVGERIGFDAIGGLDEVKRQIHRRIILPFERKGLFDRFKKRAGGGVLLYGPPGCGKTLMARATATECGATFMPVEIVDVLDKFIGESEKRVANLFAQARAKRPAVLFFDEVEALAARRRFAENSHQTSMVSTFLNEMDGMTGDNEGLLVLAATNTPWAIDTAFRRPGRFDRSLFVPPPDRPARETILAIALRGRPTESNLRLGDIAERTSGFSGADLAHVVETACDLAIERSIATDSVAPVSAADLKAAIREVKPTTAEWLTQARNYAKFANEGGFYDDVAAFLDKNGR